MDKFIYLKSLLKGPAQIAVQGLTISVENYDIAIKILDRDERKELLIRLHIDKFSTCLTLKIYANCMTHAKYTHVA